MLLVDVQLIDPRTGDQIRKRIHARVITDTDVNRRLSCEAVLSEIGNALPKMIEKALLTEDID